MSREMKNSGLPSFGIVPKDWKTTKLKNILLIRKEKSFGYGHLLSVYLDRGVISYDDSTGKQVHKPSEDLSNYQRVYINDFVLNNQQAWRGSVGVSQYDGIISPAYYVYQLSSDCIPCYMNYVLRDKCMVQQYEIVSRGVGSIQRNLFIPDFKTISLYLPSPTEQQQIVHFLDRKCTAIDTAIEKTKKSIEKLEEYKKAVITKAVTKGIDPNVKMKDSGVEWIGEIPEGWRIERCKYNFIYHKNIAGMDSINYERLALTMQGVTKRAKEDTNGLQPESFDGYQIVNEGDLIFKLIDLAGKSTSRVGLSPYTGLVSPAYILLHANDEKMSKAYAQYFFLSMWYRLIFNQIGNGGIRSSLNAADLLELPITTPKLTEQQQIVQFLDRKCTAIDTAIEKEKKAIEKWEEYKKSLIYYAVTGKIDCRGEEL